MSRLVLVESQFLSPIISYSYFVQSGNICLEMQENYQKRSYRNRCKLLGPNGIHIISIPLQQGKNQQQSIRNVKIAYDMPWITSHLNTIRTCYGSSPYFQFIFEGIQEVFRSKPRFLTDLNIKLLLYINKFLGLDLSITSSLYFEKTPSQEVINLRNCLSPVKKSFHLEQHEVYQQVFNHKFRFEPNLSILDLIFCLGKESVPYLKRMNIELNPEKISSSI